MAHDVKIMEAGQIRALSALVDFADAARPRIVKMRRSPLSDEEKACVFDWLHSEDLPFHDFEGAIAPDHPPPLGSLMALVGAKPMEPPKPPSVAKLRVRGASCGMVAFLFIENLAGGARWVWGATPGEPGLVSGDALPAHALVALGRSHPSEAMARREAAKIAAACEPSGSGADPSARLRV